MAKVETHHRRVPWSWVVWMTVPWIAMYYTENISNGGPLMFTLRKYVESPALIGLVGSLNVAFNFMVGVFTSYMSDRIWTRWGRRRPFLIVGWLGVIVAMVFVPLAPNAFALIAGIFVYQFCQDVAKPLEPLFNEVIPPAQRGRAATIRRIAQDLLTLVFFSVLVAQFDSVYDFEVLGWPVHFTGERVIYWTGGLVLLGAVSVLAFKIRETPPPQPAARERFAVGPFVRNIFGDRHARTLYLLFAAPLLAVAGTEIFEPLLRTEQLGFSKAEFGRVVALGTAVNIVTFVPLAGFLADRMSRLKLLRAAIVAFVSLNLGFFFYLRFVADYRISLWTLVGCGYVIGGFKTIMYVVWGPLVYDYVPRNRFGTVAAGFAFVIGVVPFVLINTAGTWVKVFTWLFGTRGAGPSDYSSIYLLQIVGATAALLVIGHVRREEASGRFIRHATHDLDTAEEARAE